MKDKMLKKMNCANKQSNAQIYWKSSLKNKEIRERERKKKKTKSGVGNRKPDTFFLVSKTRHTLLVWEQTLNIEEEEQFKLNENNPE